MMGKTLSGKPYSGNPTIVRAMALAAVAIFSHSALAAVTPYATLTWTGLAGDGNFTSEGNWSRDDTTKPFKINYTNDLRFIDVADNTKITIPAGTSIQFVNNITVSNQTGATRTLTIAGGSQFRNMSGAIFHIATNSTLTIATASSNPWNSLYNGFTLVGGGVLKLTGNHGGGPGIDIYSSTLVFGYASSIGDGFNGRVQTLADKDAVLELEKNTWADVRSPVAGSKIKFNGHTLYNMARSNVNEEKVIAAELSGNSSSRLTLVGAVARSLTTNSQMNGTYEIRNAKLSLGKSASEPVTIPSDSTVDMYSHGIFELFGSQQIKCLKGEGATAYVSVPEGATLTVGGSSVDAYSAYAARLSGKGDFVKRGANYTLTMTGDSTDFSGNTTVAEGTLELKRPIEYPDDYFAYWPFDGGDCDKDVISGIAWQRYTYGQESMYSVERGTGVFDDAATFVYRNGVSSNHVCTAIKANDALWRRRLDSTNFTVSVWLKPTDDDRGGQGREGTFFTFGGWPDTAPLSLANNLCKLEYKRPDKTQSDKTEIIRGYRDNPKVTISADKTLSDGKWHHIAYVHSAHKIEIWIDGELGGTWVNNNTTLYICQTDAFQLGGKDTWGSNHGYDGGLDELIIANGVWDEARIKREYNRCRETLPAVTLPNPAAVWTFDTDLKDSVGGVELESFGSDTIYRGVMTASYGKCILLHNDNHNLRIKSGCAYPFPTGQAPFTVSLRYSQMYGLEYTHTFSFGDVYTANAFFSMGHFWETAVDTCDWSHPGAKSGALDIYLSDQNNLCLGWSPWFASWVHMIATYDGRYVRLYRDGRLLSTTAAKLNLASDSQFYMGYYPNFKNRANVAVDDFRIWTNCCFTSDQVVMLARTLDGRGVVGQFTNSAVTVNSGATLKSSGVGNAVKSLSGSGTLNLSQNSTLTSGGGTFSGTVTGTGQLTLTADADLSGATATACTGTIEVKGGAATLNGTFANSAIVLSGGTATGAASDITIAEGTTIAIDGNEPTTPKITTSGRLILPETLTITVSPKIITGEIIVANAGTVVMPESTAKWTLPEGFRVRNKDGQFRITTQLGTVILMW